MYNNEIEKYFNKCHHFIGVYPRDKLPKKVYKRQTGLIINTDKSTDPGEHWVAVALLNNNSGEYFDSFGLPPLLSEIREFLENNCDNGWIYNPVTLQHPLSTSCGKYCVAYLNHRFNNSNYVEFINSFSPSLENKKKILKKILKDGWSHK